MDDAIKVSIGCHAALLKRVISPDEDIAMVAMILCKFINQAYSLHYPDDSDGHGCLFETCYHAVLSMMRT